jgi:fructosamine-3-kinase
LTILRRRVAALAGAEGATIERLAGGDLSEVLLVTRADGRCTVAKGGSAVPTEAAMLRALASGGVPVPAVEAEHDGVLLLEHVPNDGVFSPRSWASIGDALKRLHRNVAQLYGWHVDYQLGSVLLDNRERGEWPGFWAEQRLLPTAAILDRPWRERVERLAARIGDLLPERPAPSLIHGDLCSGNILVVEGRLAALIDPACYHGDREVDLATLTLFDSPAETFWASYGSLDPGWQERRAVYQLFPALVHLRLFGAAYGGLADRLLSSLRF